MLFWPHVRAAAAAVPLLAFRAVGGAVPILVGLVIAHQWGLEELAAFTLAHASITIAMVVADWGATRGLPRNLAMLPPEPAARFMASANGVRVALLAAILAAIAAVSALELVDPAVVRYLAVLFPICPLFSMTTSAVSERVVVRATAAIGVAVAAGLALFLALGAAVIAMGLSPYWFVGAFVTGKIVEAALIARGRAWVLAVSFADFRPTAAALWPFTAQGIIAVIYLRAPVFTVEHMTTRIELGVFSIAAAVQAGLLLVSASTAMATFPALTRAEQEGDARGTRQLLARYTRTTLLGVTVSLVVLALVIRPITNVLKFPERFNGFVMAFAALALIGIFSTMAGFLMQARGKETLAARLSLAALILSVVYQLVALRAMGLWGIVVAVALAEITTIAIFAVALRRSGKNEAAAPEGGR